MKTITPWLSSLLALGLMGVPTLHAPLGAQLATTSTLEADTTATSTTLAPTTATTPTLRVSRDAGNFDRLRFNFKSVPLDTVLDYLSREAGFVIIKSVSVEGTVDLVSHQPMTRTEAVALLNTVLNEKGYAAIRNDRTLTIVSRSDARQRDIPVHVGNAPETIPKSDEMVTQIIPIRYAKAEELIASIKDLLPSYATLSSNASSNAIVLTGTQTDIRRIAEIVRALDSSISSISTLRVFHLQFADSKETANLITSLFQSSSTSNRQNNNSNNPFARFRGGPFGGFGGGPGGGDSNSQNSQTTPAESAALQASSRVVAAADERTNSVVVSAPDDLMDTVAQLITSIDNSTELNTEVRVFPLKFAAADQMAATITSVFAQNQTASVRGNQRGQGFIQSMVAATQQANTSQRKQTESTVLAQADTRTNSVIVSAVSDVMEQIAKVIEQLDQNPAKSKKVYVYSVRNADPKEVTSMLQKIFGSSATAGTSTRSSTSSSRTGTSSNQRNSNSSNSNSNSSSSNRSSSSSSMR